MAKSIHFNQVPNMRGRLTMPFTDVVAENYKPRILKAIHEREMWDWHGDVYTRDEAEFDHYLRSEEYLSSWDCDVCNWQEFTGEFKRHHHEFD